MWARRIVTGIFALLGIAGLGFAGWIITNYFIEETHDSDLITYLLAAAMFGVPGALFLGLAIALGWPLKARREG